MRVLAKGYRGLELLAQMNLDRGYVLVALTTALLAAAYFGHPAPIH